MSQEGHDMTCFDAATTLGHLEVEKKGEHCVVPPQTHLLRLYWGKRRRELAGIIEILDRGRGHFLGLQKRQKT